MEEELLKRNKIDDKGNEYKYKLVWWEDESKRPGVAYGNEFFVDTSSCLLYFEGRDGQIIIPTRTGKFIVK